MDERPDTLPETPVTRFPVQLAQPVSTESEPVRPLEVASVLVATLIADLAIFRGGGYSGMAVMLAATPLLLLIGSPVRRPLAATWIFGFAILLLTARLVWCGSPLVVFCGLASVCVFSLGLAGRTVHILESFAYAWCVMPSGFAGLVPYWNISKRGALSVSPKWLNVLLPAFALCVFGLLFIGANPHLVDFVSTNITNLIERLESWLIHTSPAEMVFLAFVAVVFVGLLRPLAAIEEIRDTSHSESPKTHDESFFYTPFRNTMVTVTILFTVYLVFEFQTLWFREFPAGFYYSGYAHEGAAWLTVALAVATGMLSLIFRGDVLSDPRIGRLRILAWIWSAENLILGLAVFNRMFIYIHFNGMTRMRVIGMFGISTVIAGFAMVVVKIIRNRSFLWLLRAHLFTLTAAVFLYSLTPVDWYVTRYNVHRIENGDLAPAVQISVHPINSEGLLQLLPLLDHDNILIREGIQAVLAEAHLTAESSVNSHRHWSHYQMTDQILLAGCRANQSKWQDLYQDNAKRIATRKRFDDFVYQWY